MLLASMTNFRLGGFMSAIFLLCFCKIIDLLTPKVSALAWGRNSSKFTYKYGLCITHDFCRPLAAGSKERTPRLVRLIPESEQLTAWTKRLLKIHQKGSSLTLAMSCSLGRQTRQRLCQLKRFGTLFPRSFGRNTRLAA